MLDDHREDETAGPGEQPADEPGDGPGDGTTAVTDLSDEVVELEDRLRRALADLDNLRKRFQREVERERAAERARVAAQFLPIVDNLELALQHAAAEPSAVLEGVQAVRDHAVSVLAHLGFPRFDEVGVSFDPVLHEAVGTVNGNAPPGTVIAVVRPGYGTAEALLRPAGVVVARGRD